MIELDFYLFTGFSRDILKITLSFTRRDELSGILDVRIVFFFEIVEEIPPTFILKTREYLV